MPPKTDQVIEYPPCVEVKGAAMAIITISSELGTGGPEIGATLAKRLGYRYLDREVIAEAKRLI